MRKERLEPWRENEHTQKIYFMICRGKGEGVTEDVLYYDHLTEREKAVIQMYYVENKLTRKEIATEFDVTEERLRQIIRRALRRIRVRANIKITKKI